MLLLCPRIYVSLDLACSSCIFCAGYLFLDNYLGWHCGKVGYQCCAPMTAFEDYDMCMCNSPLVCAHILCSYCIDRWVHVIVLE